MTAPLRTAGPSLLHLSDLHFGREHPPAVRALSSLVDALAPEVIVVTGDLTQRARPAEFRSAKHFLTRLRCRHLVVQPGNHDIPLWAWWERLLWPHRRFEATFAGPRCPSLDLPWLRLVMADSVARTRHAGGEISARESARVASLISLSRPGQLRVVALHHPLAGPPGALYGAPEALRRWTAAGAQLVLAGHVHQPGVTDLPAPGSPEARLWAVAAGTAVSRRLRAGAPASVNLVGPAGTQGDAWLQRWDFGPHDETFRPGPMCALPHLGLPAAANPM